MPQIIQRSFTAGELSPPLQSRADLSKYSAGLSLCENFFIRSQGGIYSRPGFKYIGPQSDHSKKGRLIPFSFNTQQTYILVFEHLKMRVIKNGGYVLAGGGPAIFEISTPYIETDLPRLGYTQSADVMTIVHPSYDDRDLSRLADDNWTLVVNNYASTVTAPVISSVVAGGAGAGSFNRKYEYVVTAVDDNGIESLASAAVNITTASLSQTAYNRVTWSAVTGASYYRIYKDPSADTGIYGWIGDSDNLTFDDFNIAPITSDAPPEDRQPFTGVGNKPAVVNYFQQRKIFANTNNEPQAVFTTQTGKFKSLRTSNPARDDDAITFTIAAQQVNEIRHLLSLDSLILLTSGGEWIATEGQDKVLTPATIGVRPQSYNGSSWVKPVVINSTALYLQEKNARIRDLGYQFSSDKYTGNDLSIMSEHLFSDYTITEMAYADEPYGVLWCVRSDGVMLGLTYQREHEVWGWHQHNTLGSFESVATISEDGRDALYAIIKRTINGSTVRYIERLEKVEKNNAENAFCVDSGLSYIGASSIISGATQTNPIVITSVGHPHSNGDTLHIKNITGMVELNNNNYLIGNVTTNTFELTGIDGTGFTPYVSGGIAAKAVLSISGLDHLEGENVIILADANVIEGKTISSGIVTLDTAASIIHVGLAYTPAMETLDLDVAAAAESLKARSLSVSKVVIEVENSRGGFIGARVDSNTDKVVNFTEIKPRFESDNYDPIALKTHKEEVIIQPDWGKSGGVRIEQRSPLPLNILSVIPQVDIGGN